MKTREQIEKQQGEEFTEIMEGNKIKFYKSAAVAYRAAEKRGEIGLTGSGQTCHPVEIVGYGYAYKTWDNRYIVPRGKLPKEFIEAQIEKYGHSGIIPAK